MSRPLNYSLQKCDHFSPGMNHTASADAQAQTLTMHKTVLASLALRQPGACALCTCTCPGWDLHRRAAKLPLQHVDGLQIISCMNQGAHLVPCALPPEPWCTAWQPLCSSGRANRALGHAGIAAGVQPALVGEHGGAEAGAARDRAASIAALHRKDLARVLPLLAPDPACSMARPASQPQPCSRHAPA